MQNSEPEKISEETHLFLLFWNLFYVYLLYDFFSDGIIGAGGITRAKIVLTGSDALVWLAGFFVFTAIVDTIYIKAAIRISANQKLQSDPYRQSAFSFRKLILGIAYYVFWYFVLFLVTTSRIEDFSITTQTLFIYPFYGWGLHLTYSFFARTNIYIPEEKIEPEDYKDTIYSRSAKNARRIWFILGVFIMATCIWFEYPSGT